MKRMLCITANMNAGGAETFLMKIYRCLDRNEYQMDFCVSVNENTYADEIEKMGGKLYIVPAKTKQPFKAFYSIKDIVKENNYMSVMRVNEHSLATIDLLAAKCGGAEKLIMRSSNSSSDGKISSYLHRLFRILPQNIPTVKIAPSKLAAEYTFGSKKANKEVKILKNGLNIDEYSYSEENRVQLRKELLIEDKFAVGHVGRFNKQKNHEFLIEIFYEFQKNRSDAVLVLVGDGILMEKIKQKVIELGIEDKCIFTGVRRDVNKLLSAMDVFVFPSLYEGMPNTVIEAQTTGLNCLISDSITHEADVIGSVEYMSLMKSSKEWADRLLKISKEKFNRNVASEKMRQQGYDIKDVTREFIKLVY